MTALAQVERHGAAGVAGAAAARNDRQAELDAAGDQAGHLGLGVGREDDERILDAPVGRVGDVRDARQAVELDVVLRGHLARARAPCACAGPTWRGTAPRTPRRRRATSASSSPTTASRAASAPRRAALLDFAEPMVQRLDQQLPAARVVEQVVLQVRVALHDPDVAQHLVEHARRAAGAPLAAQHPEHLPGARAEQADDDLAVGERGVVVGNLAQARRRAGRLGGSGDLVRAAEGAFMRAGARIRGLPRGREASYRSAANRRSRAGRGAARCAAGIPACRREPARDKRGCHFEPSESRRRLPRLADSPEPS